MKQKLLFLATVLVCLSISNIAHAETFCSISPSGHYLYYETYGGGVRVTTPTTSNWAGYAMPTGDVIIPSTVYYLGTTYYVSEIRYRAFAGCTGITSISIPNTVNKIGWEAFSGCTGLTSVSIPTNVSNIGYSAFQYCSNLTSVEYNAQSCNTVSYSNPVFGNCPNLDTINIGATVNNIPFYLFKGCNNISSISVSSGNYVYDSRNDCNAIIKKSNNRLILGCKNTTIPNTVTSIGQSAFRWSPQLTSLNIPNSVTSIGDSAFMNCSNMSSITLPNSIVSLGAYLFYNCSNLNTIVIPNTITSIGDLAFSGCSSLSSVNIPDGVSTIGWGAFSNCNGLSSIILPNSLTAIGIGVFSECLSLNNVTIPSSVTSIGGSAFYMCYNLTTIYCEAPIPPVLLSTDIFTFTDLTNIYVPCNSVSAYQSASGWNNYSSIISRPPFEYSYSFYSSDNIRGSINNISNLDCDSNLTVTVNSNYGYHLSGWSDGGIGNPRTFHITQDTSVTAYFDKNIYSITVNSSDTLKGYTTGNASVEYLDMVSISASANYGYHFVYWDDNDTNNTRQIQVTQDEVYTAFFDFNQYSIELFVDATIHGTVFGDGNYNYLSQRTITANPSFGYHFTQWNDGNTDNPRIITLTKDTSFTAYFAKNIYQIAVIANDSLRGVVTGNDTVEYLDTVILTATANYGYHFARWDDNNTTNPRQIQVTQNKTYIAYFDYNQYSITLTVDTSIHGNVAGSGYYDYLSQCTLTASPNHGYHFTQWSDGNTLNPRTITLTHDTNFIAEFEINTYIVNVITSDSIMGTAAGGGAAVYLDSLTLTANAHLGYHFTHWSDGDTTNPRQILVTDNQLYTAYFDFNQYEIVLDVDTVVHGMCMGNGNYNYLSSQTITAVPNYGYHFTNWNDGDTNNPRVITITQDTAFIAHFAKNTYTLTLQSNDTLFGIVTGSTMCEYLDTVSILATVLMPHYHFVQWSDGDTAAIRNIVITKDSSIMAFFAIDTHNVNVSTNGYGYVTGTCIVPYGSEVIVTATAMEGYHFAKWSNGSRNNPDTITVTNDTSLMAIFVDNLVPQICMVSVQDGKNVVIWDRGIEVTEYNIYREGNVTDEYELVGTILYDSLSVWIDSTSRPATHSYRYRMTATDLFGYESEAGEVHKTMHLTISQGVGNRWNLVWTPYEGADYSTYVIYRGTNASNIQQIDMIAAGGNTTYTDEDATSGDVYYQVGILMNNDCTPTSTKSGSISLSNIATNSAIGITNTSIDKIRVFSIDNRIVITGTTEEARVYDILGRIVANYKGPNREIPVSEAGVYLVKIGNYPARKVVVMP